MKVIKKGKPDGWSKKFKCSGSGNGDGGCGALLEVAEKDLIHTQSHALSDTDDHITFECCECGKWTDVDGKVPSSVEDSVYKKRVRVPRS